VIVNIEKAPGDQLKGLFSQKLATHLNIDTQKARKLVKHVEPTGKTTSDSQTVRIILAQGTKNRMIQAISRGTNNFLNFNSSTTKETRVKKMVLGNLAKKIMSRATEEASEETACVPKVNRNKSANSAKMNTEHKSITFLIALPYCSTLLSGE
jgi:hypothetical protein